MATKQKAKTKTRPATKAKPAPTRVRKLTRRGRKKAVRQQKRMPGGIRILRSALGHLWAHKRLFGIIFGIYLALYVLLVKGLATNFQLNQTRLLLEETFGDTISSLETSAALFGSLLGTAGASASEAGSVYQIVLLMLFSLIIIWCLRASFERKNGDKISIKRAFYTSTYPLVPYVLVGLVMLVQLVPALLVLTIYSVVSANNIAFGAAEQIFWFVLMLTGMAVSVYWLCSSVFASYIVTLPNTSPMIALRSARKLVKYRRWTIIRRLLFLPFVLMIFLLVVFLPLVFFAPVLAEVAFLVASLAGLFVAHAYVYVLYRELL